MSKLSLIKKGESLVADFKLSHEGNKVYISFNKNVEKKEQNFIRSFVKESISKLEYSENLYFDLKKIELSYISKDKNYNVVYQSIKRNISNKKVIKSLRRNLTGDYADTVSDKLQIPLHLAQAKCESISSML